MEPYAIPGIHTRRPLCKICQAFDDATLAEITLDILLRRRTWAEIRRHYTGLLPAGLTAISDINIKNHKKHCNPEKIAHEALRAQGKPTNELERLESVYSELVGKEMKSQEILRKTFFDRISNAQILQERVTQLRREYNALLAAPATPLTESQRTQLFNKIRPLVSDLDEVYSSLQQIALKDIDVQKDKGDESLMLIQSIIRFFQEQLSSFGKEMVNYILVQEFADDPERAQVILKRLSGIMDTFLAPALDSKRVFRTISKRQVDDATFTEEKL